MVPMISLVVMLALSGVGSFALNLFSTNSTAIPVVAFTLITLGQVCFSYYMHTLTKRQRDEYRPSSVENGMNETQLKPLTA